MIYATYEDYLAIYGENALPQAAFNRLSWEVCRRMDYFTTGVDGYKKLKEAFPTDEDDVTAVKRCCCQLIKYAADIEAAEENAAQAQQYIQREDGTITNKVVSSLSAGNESMSFATSNRSAGETLASKTATDIAERKKVEAEIVRDCLSGTKDANGVNLLYVGVYPCIKTR